MLIQTRAGLTAAAVDDASLLRFWAEVWVNGFRASHKPNSVRTNLRHVDAFHRWCDSVAGDHSLDRAFGSQDAKVVHRLIEDFYTALASSVQRTTTDVQMWESVRNFVVHFARAWSSTHQSWKELLYAVQLIPALSTSGVPRVVFVRALPAVTLSELFEIARPDSSTNPFQSASVRLRNWLLLHLLVEYGLRRGETMLLTVDSLMRDVDTRTGDTVCWLRVTNTDDEFEVVDRRSTAPSIKTNESHRPVPVSTEFAELWDVYISQARVDSDEHAFLLTSRSGAPLSAETIAATLATLTSALSAQARAAFNKVSGGKVRISPHDLRHTCATVRYTAFAELGGHQDLVYQRMRAFFGWSATSDMPELYAKAAIRDDLRRTWNALFGEQLAQWRRS